LIDRLCGSMIAIYKIFSESGEKKLIFEKKLYIFHYMPRTIEDILAEYSPENEYEAEIPMPGIWDEARFLPMPSRGFRTPKPPKQTIPMPKIPPQKVLEAVRTTLAPFTLQGAIHGINKTSERAKEGVNAFINRITYPEELINETLRRVLYKY